MLFENLLSKWIVCTRIPFGVQTTKSHIFIKHCIRKCGLGSPYSANFVLQTSSGMVYHFMGRPDFTINSPTRWFCDQIHPERSWGNTVTSRKKEGVKNSCTLSSWCVYSWAICKGTDLWIPSGTFLL